MEKNVNRINHKYEIVVFVVGLLVGAVISAGAFLAYSLANNSGQSETHSGPMGTPPLMQQGEQSAPPSIQGNQDTSPDLPDGE